MAITIDWAAKVINVPRADMTLVQSAPPIEIRELNLSDFRLALKNLEDGEEGMCFPDTHVHFTEVQLGAMTLARVIEIVNGYTVTFEDGQYAVNAVGANSNLLDVLNPNQVSVRANNSAGLTANPTAALLAGEVLPGVSLKIVQRILLAAEAGKVSGITDGIDDEWIEILEALVGDKVRIRALTDRFGNRKQVDLDVSE